MNQTPVPVRLLHRPRVGGLVVPFISYAHGGHALFGSVNPLRRAEALLCRLCQICGHRLEERFCLAVRPMDVRAGAAPEPGLHPECLAYSTAACPMLNGAVSEYRSTSATTSHPAGRPCGDPSCPCPRIASDAQHEIRSGRPADDWDSWMIRGSHYRLKRDPDRPHLLGGLLGVDLDVPVLRVRPLRRTPSPRLDRTQADQLRAALRALEL
ncbi:cell envelope biogenesis protein OmpA [Streptomyces marianii]|uniref:Cell envelope biogenesis protein OmpA n=1 Tax=Streptomyces marianii TaxID=1817406 RepID=A0A5R9DU61_9ACTN|nr:cell envelope biogenesis protein OmpA [Streptomyces marianii]TLQ39278.1 cell envelope biogenesis protein OmpA [Streptomyces marianii]